MAEDTSEFIAQLEQYRKMKQELAAQLKVLGKHPMTGLFKEFFALCPEVESVQWNQYIPHFNDGDPCVFRVNEPKVRLSGQEEYVDGWDLTWSINPENPRRKCTVPDVTRDKMYNRISDGLGALMTTLTDLDEIVQEAFGDGVEVTVTPAGEITIEEYDHD